MSAQSSALYSHQGGLPTAAAADPGRVVQREREHRGEGRNALKKDEPERWRVRTGSATPPEMNTSTVTVTESLDRGAEMVQPFPLLATGKHWHHAHCSVGLEVTCNGSKCFRGGSTLNPLYVSHRLTPKGAIPLFVAFSTTAEPHRCPG